MPFIIPLSASFFHVKHIFVASCCRMFILSMSTTQILLLSADASRKLSNKIPWLIIVVETRGPRVHTLKSVVISIVLGLWT